MCNVIFFSTDISEDFSKLDTKLFRCYVPPEDVIEMVRDALANPNTCYLACRYGGCSCHFRHAQRFSKDKSFRPATPEDDEDADNIESTEAFYDLCTRLVLEGHRIDIYDTWDGEEGVVEETREISVRDLSRDAFRFVEYCRIVLIP